MKKPTDKGWKRGISLVLQENDLVEITCALKHYHNYLKEPGHPGQEDWPLVRESIRGILKRLYHARGIEDQDPVREREAEIGRVPVGGGADLKKLPCAELARRLAAVEEKLRSELPREERANALFLSMELRDETRRRRVYAISVPEEK